MFNSIFSHEVLAIVSWSTVFGVIVLGSLVNYIDGKRNNFQYSDRCKAYKQNRFQAFTCNYASICI